MLRGHGSNLNIAVVSIALIATFFLWTNFDAGFGALTSGMLIVYLIFLSSRKLRQIPMIRPGAKFTKTVIFSVVGFAIWVVLANVITATATGAVPNFFSLDAFAILAENTQVPILATDATTTFISYGIIIPIAESVLFLSFVAVALMAVTKTKFRFDMKSPKMMFIVAGVGMTVALFHITVRGFGDLALVTDSVFFGLSMLLVFWRGHMAEAIAMHVLNNSMVLAVGQ